jgi:alkanesulfonate monooxygenase SsuD/methylene tetrahydromethanopterin reductase-like flavin-dependent oxidoreductase (luciferase family)
VLLTNAVLEEAMKLGLFCQSTRVGVPPQDSWQQDLEDIIHADGLGFTETWVAEHIGGGSRMAVMPAVDLFICKAAGVTRNMRFGPGIRNLPFHHPVEVAIQAAMCDVLTGGRYNAGFGSVRAAGERSYFPQFGIDATVADERDMVQEAIDLILQCWMADEPFDFEGRFWHGEGIIVHPKSLQQPHVPVGMANSGTIATAQYIGRQGFFPLYYFFDTAQQLKELADAYVEAGEAAGKNPSRDNLRVSRIVYLADTDKEARDRIRDDIQPRLERYRQNSRLRHLQRSVGENASLDEVDFDFLVDAGIFLVGSPDTVYQRIQELYEEMGGFGVLLSVIGHSIATLEERKRSRQLFVDEVAPRLQSLQPAVAAAAS